MVLAVLSFNIVHPGSFLVGPDSELPGLIATIKGMWHKNRGKDVAEPPSGRSDDIALL